MKIGPSVLLLTFAYGCAQEETPQHARIPSNVVEGVGIPGHLEIGMRLDSIPDAIPDATCKPSSRMSLAWWFGETWRKHPPWKKPATYELRVPNMGACVFNPHPTNAIRQIHFHVIKHKGRPAFSGTLSGGLSFSGTGTVSLAEVTALYGEPLHTLTYPSAADAAGITNGMLFLQQQETILESGQSLLMTYDTGHPYRLHYPARGIYFDIQEGRVHSFRVFRKVKPTE